MAITFSIDNDRIAAGIQSLTEDESAGVQTPATTDTGNEIDVTLTAGALGGFATAFNTFLNGTLLNGFVLSGAQKTFASTNDGASSSADFVKVTASNGETVSDLFFSDSSGNALDGDQVVGMQTLDGLNVYLWSNGDYAIATTSSTAGAGRVVAAFYLNDTAADHLTAQVQMVTFEALKHPDATNPDDSLNFTNALQISAAGTKEFNFNTLGSGDFLWVAVGDSGSAVLVTAGNPQVGSDNKMTNTSGDIHVSQGGDGTTIGINNQLFDASGETGVFTLVKGLTTLPAGTTGAGGVYTVDPKPNDNKLEGIDYSDYINVSGAGIYISQSQGTPSVGKDFEFKLLNAGASIEDLTNYVPGLASDGSVNVGTVTVTDDAGHVVGVWGTGGLSNGTVVHNVSPNGPADISVTISGSTADVHGVLGNYTVDWTAASGTFNRFDITWLAGKFDVGRVDIAEAVGNSVGVGGNLILQDDHPSISASLVGAPSITDDETNLLIDNSASFAAQFSPTYGTDGQAATPVTYALSTPGGDSGLVDTASGNKVFLFLESGQVVGREGTTAGTAAAGPIVFTVSVDGTGQVTLDQQRAIVHPDATNPDDSKTLSAANLVVLTAVAHDGDGDAASAPLNIGQLLNFKDDGPSIDASAVNAPSITVDETNLLTDHSASYAAQFSPVYGADGQGATPITYDLGTPGGDSGLVDTASGNSVFLFLESGQVVGREGADAASAAAGPIVFTVSVDSSGQVTLDQQRAIVHPDATNPDDSKTLSAADLVVLNATAHDKDGDTALAALNIGQLLNFKDDGPSITASVVNQPSLTVDDSALGTDDTQDFSQQFVPTYGVDGQGGTPVTYALSTTSGADSGLIESGSGNHVFLFKVGDDIVGKSGTTALTAASGPTVFVVSVDSAGQVTLVQQRAVVHNPQNGIDQSTTLTSAGLVVLTATAHDADGDTAPASLNIGQLLNFKDDAPTITQQIQNGTVAFAADATGTVTNSLFGSVGADINNSSHQSLSGVMQYTITSWSEPHSVYPNLDGVLSADGATLTYYSDLAHTNAVYSLSLNQTANAGAGSYTFTVLQPPPITTTHFGFSDLHSGQNLFGIIAVDKADLTKGGLLVMPNNPVLSASGTMTNTSGSICTSQGGGGVTIGNTNQAFDHPGEGAFFLYCDNPLATATSGVGLTPTGANDADTIRFNGVNQATDASVEIVQASGKGTLKSPGPAIHIAAFEANPGNVNSDTLARAEVTNPTLAAANQGTAAPEVDIIGIKIHDATGKVIEYRTVDQTAGAANGGALHDVNGDGLVNASDDSLVGIQFVLDNPKGGGTADDIYSAVVSNLALHYTVEFITATNHDLALVENVSGSYDLGGFDVSNNANVAAQDFNFSVQINDYDNDAYGGQAVTFANFSVHVNDVLFV